MENIVGIWHDSAVFNGRGTKTDFNNDRWVFDGPNNKREVPCGDCTRKQVCGVEMVDCKAFREWTSRGNYKDSDVELKLKALK